MMSDTDNIKDICQEALDNTEITNETLCDDTHDYYLLGKVDLAKEILEELNKKPKEIKEEKKPKATTQKEWVKGYNKWKEEHESAK